MQISKKDAADVFLAIKMDKEVVDGWEAPQLQKKLLKIEQYVPKGHVIEDARLAKLFTQVVAAVKAGEDISVTDDGTPKPPARPAPKPPAKQPAADPAKPAPKPAKAKAGAKPAGTAPTAARVYAKDNGGRSRYYHGRGLSFGNQGVGIIQRVAELLVEAGAKNRALTRDQIHKVLVKEYPTRGKDGMWTTVITQVPNRLRTVRGLDVKGDPKAGYWIDAKGEKVVTEGKTTPKEPKAKATPKPKPVREHAQRVKPKATPKPAPKAKAKPPAKKKVAA